MIVALAVGGIPVIIVLSRHMVAGEFGADLLAAASIMTAILMGEDLVAAVVVLMLSGGTALEQYATRRASSVLNALANRTCRGSLIAALNSGFTDVALEEVVIGDRLIRFAARDLPVGWNGARRGMGRWTNRI